MAVIAIVVSGMVGAALAAAVIVIVERDLRRMDLERKAGQAFCDRENAKFKEEWLAAHPGWPDDGKPWRFWRMQ